jgi:flagella basal body P-ring formation protein FlgA
VSVSVSAPRVVSARQLNPGRPIDAAALRIETGEYFPEPGNFAVSVEDVAGKMPRRTIRPGSPILLQWLVAPPAVERGEPVQVEVRAGAARLKFDAKAERAGAVGDSIPVRNPASGKLFSARVEGKGRVSVDRGDL